MTSFLDTSIVVRYLTGQPAALFERAKAVIDGTEPLHITDVVIAEIAFVLGSFYRFPRATVVDCLIDFLQKENIVAHDRDKGTVTLALMLCRPSGRVSFPDALLWAAARSVDTGLVYTFDRRFPSGGIEVREE
jgi:predicted nucleic acid-binding protein